jgi:hypothetical protein
MAKSSAILQLPRGCAWPCLVIGVILALLGLGSLLGPEVVGAIPAAVD